MLSFKLSPLLITNTVRIDDGKPSRTIRFDTRMNTHSEKRKQNTISDGTRMDHLPCGATIYCLGEGGHTPDKGYEYLMFYSSEFSSERHYSPAHFHLQVHLQSTVFDELWRTVSEERSHGFSR